MLIAEELLLLSLDDETGHRTIGDNRLDPALGGALFAELALMERICITGPEAGFFGKNKLTVVSDRPTDDPELDRALAAVVQNQGKTPQQLIGSMAWRPITKGGRDRLLRRLAERGVLTEEKGTVLGVIPVTRWPTHDPEPERQVDARLRSVLVDGVTADDRTRTLVALLRATGLLSRVVSLKGSGIDRATLRRRVQELSEGDWASAAVKKVIDDATAVMVTVIS